VYRGLLTPLECEGGGGRIQRGALIFSDHDFGLSLLTRCSHASDWPLAAANRRTAFRACYFARTLGAARVPLRSQAAGALIAHPLQRPSLHPVLSVLSPVTHSTPRDFLNQVGTERRHHGSAMLSSTLRLRTNAPYGGSHHSPYPRATTAPCSPPRPASVIPRVLIHDRLLLVLGVIILLLRRL
jgi:hypothetical protein